MKLNYYEIGNRIRDIREELDLSQAAFAEMIGISREHMGRIERNPKNPSIELLANISYCTGYSVDYILFGHTYPDMELMPSIANYFGVSIDHLFGYSHEREAKISVILESVEQLNDESWRDDTNLDECISILRRGLEEFPGNERIMNRLALILKQAGWARHHEWLSYGEDGHLHSDFDRHRKNPYWVEAIELFQRLSTDAMDRDIRYSAVGELVLLYRTTGDVERAKIIAESMPSIALCREVILATATDGAEQTAYYAEACIALLRTFREQFV